MSHAPAPQPFWDDEVTPNGPSEPDWIWQGFLAKGYTTVLTSLWKAGKTTLLSMLLGRRAGGGPLAGLGVTAGRTAIVSEEPRALWEERIRRYNFGGNVCLFTEPFLAVPTAEQWHALIARILELHRARNFDLVVVDPLAPFLTCENNARSMLDALLPLSALTRAGMAVWLLHHPAKKGGPRGSGALLGHVAISIEMRHPGGDPNTRRRRFLSRSRFSQTPRQLLLEMNPEATDYLPAAESEAGDEFANYVEAFQMVLEDAPQKLTRADILAEWPEDFDKPADSTLKRWLARALKAQHILCAGTGRKRDPLRYWLAETEAKWRADKGILYDAFEEIDRTCGFVPLHGNPDDYVSRARPQPAAPGNTGAAEDECEDEDTDDDHDPRSSKRLGERIRASNDGVPVCHVREWTELDRLEEERLRKEAEAQADAERAAKEAPRPLSEIEIQRQGMAGYLENLQKPWTPQDGPFPPGQEAEGS